MATCYKNARQKPTIASFSFIFTIDAAVFHHLNSHHPLLNTTQDQSPQTRSVPFSSQQANPRLCGCWLWGATTFSLFRERTEAGSHSYMSASQLSGIWPGAACYSSRYQCDKATHNINQTDVTYLLTCPIASTCSWRLIRASCRAGICALIEPREGCSPLQFSRLECMYSLRRFAKISAVYVSSGNNVLNANDSMKTLLQGPVLGGFMESENLVAQEASLVVFGMEFFW